MNLSISGWSLYNNPYYTSQSSRSSNNVSEWASSNNTSGDTLTLSGAFSERLAAAVQNANNNNNSNTGQSAASGQMMPPPPPPPMQAGTDSETDSVLMEQRAENLETAYNEVSTLDPENMSEEEIDAALANIKAVLETGDANSVTEAEAEAGRAAGFDLSVLDDLANLSLEEKQEILSNLQTEIIDKYERISSAETGEEQNAQAALGGMGGPPPGGPPPGGPPASEADFELMEQRAENLETAYSYVSELETGTGYNQTGFQGNAMSQVNINGISGNLLSALWNVYGQQQSNTIAGADVLNQI